MVTTILLTAGYNFRIKIVGMVLAFLKRPLFAQEVAFYDFEFK